MSALTFLAVKIADGVFGYLVSVTIEESHADERLRKEIRKRLGKKSPEQLAFALAVERALVRLDAAYPGWGQSLFDERLLTGDDAAAELARLLQRRGQPDAGALADAWARSVATERPDLKEEAGQVATRFLAFLDEELDAPDVRPVLAPLRNSRDLGALREQGEVLQALVEQVLARLDEKIDPASVQVEILTEARRQGALRVEESVIVHGNVSRTIIITGDGNRIELNLPSDVLSELMNAMAAGRASEQLSKAYLKRLLEQKWSSVSMSLFAPQDASLGKRVKLTAIYTPLPVDFPVSLKFGKKGRLVDWWVEREVTSGGEGKGAELAMLAAMEKQDRGTMKLRSWPDLAVDESTLRPLVEGVAETLQKEREDEEIILWRPDACHAALLQPHFVLVGDPGGGKSTFLRHLAQVWAGELLRCMGGTDRAHALAGLEDLPGWGVAYIPIYLELRQVVDGFPKLPEKKDLAPELPGSAAFRAYLEEAFDAATCQWLFDALEDGEAAILLDGLDEVAQADDPRRRAQIQAFAGELSDQFVNARIIVTSRPYAYRQNEWRLDGFGRAALAPLPRERQALLAERLFQQLEPGRAQRETKAFVRALEKIPDDLSSNPLLLTLLAAIWKRRQSGERDLPSTRGELYRRGLMLLLEEWVRQKRQDFSIKKDLDLNAEDMRLVLQLVAAQAQEKREAANKDPVITAGDIFEALLDINRGNIATSLVVNHLQSQAGVLQALAEESPGIMLSTYSKRFRFLHQSFQEYLAACEYLYRNEQERPHHLRIPDGRRFPNGLSDQVVSRPDLWRNVLRLAVDELIYQGRRDDAWELLSEICLPYLEDGAASAKAPQAASLALDIAETEGFFKKYDRMRDRQFAVFYQDLQAAAVKALTDMDAFPSPEDRDIAGRLLGQGDYPGHDPRPGVGVMDGLPVFDWVRIPDGKFIYQEEKRKIKEAFWISRYPVTYAQFGAFLRAEDGFANPEWWKGLAADKDHRSQPGDQAFRYWNHPRESVSWYDAIAFSRWLTAKISKHPQLLPAALRDQPQQWRITLPTEWQWERAARGNEGNEYPWGPNYEGGRANIDENYGNAGLYYLQKTSAVGMYPHGKSPDGVLDMSGNVWEWCLSEYLQSDRIQEEGDARRVLRGGSFGDLDVRAAFRDGYLPNLRYYYLGFRVVFSPSTTDH